MRIVPKNIPILKWDAPSISPVFQVLQTQTKLLSLWQEFKNRFSVALTWWQEFKKKSPFAPLGLLQVNKRWRAQHFSYNSALRTPLRQFRQARFCWLFSSCRATATQATSATTLTEFPNFQKPSLQQCPLSMGNQALLNCLNISSKRVQKSTISSKKKSKKLFPLSHACWCAVDVQKHQQLELREPGRNPGCLP